jgi:hypothetical protein
MTASLTLASRWAIIASVVARAPRRFHWPGVVALIAAGIPLPGWVTWQNGPLWGMPVLAGGRCCCAGLWCHLRAACGGGGCRAGAGGVGFAAVARDQGGSSRIATAALCGIIL